MRNTLTHITLHKKHKNNTNVQKQSQHTYYNITQEKKLKYIIQETYDNNANTNKL